VRKPRVIPDEDHEVVYERVAAVDVAKASGVVCMRLPDPARPGRYSNQIWDNVPAARARIAELGRELLRRQVQMVTLESTSDYWRIWLRREAPCCIPGLVLQRHFVIMREQGLVGGSGRLGRWPGVVVATMTSAAGRRVRAAAGTVR
jgi:hypothetical protein